MLSHHGNSPEKMAQLAKINRYHMEFFAYYLQRMKDTRDGEGSLLDRTLVIRGSAFGENAAGHLQGPCRRGYDGSSR